MLTRLLTFFVGVIVFLMCLSISASCLEKTTHEEINLHIATNQIGGFSLDIFLKEMLGIKNGIDEVLQNENSNNPIWRWIRLGGRREDEPVLRSFNHFHNPLEPWNRAGLKYSTIGASSVIWAQTEYQPLGRHSWQDVRRYFYLALISHEKVAREKYLAEAFQGIGQLMHLVQDASVPLHTRDDIHVAYTYEGWVDEFMKKEPETFSGWMDEPIGFDESVLSSTPNPLASIPIAKIIDIDQYDGTNPDDTTLATIGLAEYSNANFFSEDTTFRDFPYPAWESVESEPHEILDPRDPSRKVWREYYRKMRHGEVNKDGDIVKGYLLAAAGFLRDVVVDQVPSFLPEYPNYEIPVLDSNVYRDYAYFLIRRAVGYSAGLFKYFFRGQIDFRRSGISSNGGIELTVTNRSDDALVEGEFELYYDAQDGDQEVRKKLALDRSRVNDLGKDMTFITNFLPPTDFFPGKENFYTLVYHGKLGNEEEAVIGRYGAVEPYACCDVPHTDPSWTGPVTIGFTALTQGCSDTQIVGATGGCPPYTWAIVAGEGTIVPVDENGFQALYTAPATNPGCTMNPTLVLTDYCGDTDSMQMALNCDPPGCPAAGVIWQLVYEGCGQDGPDLFLCSYHTEKWTIRCDGSKGHYESYYWVPDVPQYYMGDCNGWYCYDVYVHGSCGNCPPACDTIGMDLICAQSWWRPPCSETQLHFCGEWETVADTECIEAGCCGINPFTGVPYSYPEY